MVSTRNHPGSFSTPEKPSIKDLTNSSSLAKGKKIWSHTPSNLTLLWLFISLPLVIWDTGYMLLRPHSMPGGKWHGPWKPYELYAQVDYVYGFPDYESKDGFGGAQSTMNVVETLLYFWYLFIVYKYNTGSTRQGRGAPAPEEAGWLGKGRILVGEPAANAVVIGLSAAIMTLSKTVLYGLREYFSGFKGVGHNDAYALFVLWILPNGFWLILPTYMTFVFSKEIIQGLQLASGAPLVDNLGIKEE